VFARRGTFALSAGREHNDSRRTKTTVILSICHLTHRDGWKVFDAVGVEPVFPKKDHAIDYAQGCASIRKTVAVTAQASDEGAASDEVAGLL